MYMYMSLVYRKYTQYCARLKNPLTLYHQIIIITYITRVFVNLSSTDTAGKFSYILLSRRIQIIIAIIIMI